MRTTARSALEVGVPIGRHRLVECVVCVRVRIRRRRITRRERRLNRLVEARFPVVSFFGFSVMAIVAIFHVRHSPSNPRARFTGEQILEFTREDPAKQTTEPMLFEPNRRQHSRVTTSSRRPDQSFASRTASTEQGAKSITEAAVLPSVNRCKPLRPRVPTTTSSAATDSA